MIHVVDDPRYRKHEGPAGHPERPERLLSVADALAEHSERIVRVDSRAASDEELLRVHSASMLESVAEAASRAPAQIDADTYVSPLSAEVARLAAGSTAELALRVGRGEARHALAAVRPPGHHAEAGHAMGFCLFNNAAVAVRAAQAALGIEKVLLFDFDVHHGNGTQHSFEDDPSVLYISTHQFPYYPGTGAFGERGVGRGLGTTLNIPLPAGCGNAEYIGVTQRLIVPAVLAYQPQMIIVSAGYDAHRDDPLASMDLDGEGYGAIVRILRSLADDLCAGRMLFVLEGGYARSGLYDGLDATLGALGSAETGVLPEAVEAPTGSTLKLVCERVVSVHGSAIPGLGAS